MSASAAIRAPEPWLELPGGFPPDTISFALRTTLALLLAYYVAFWIQLDSASTAGICVAIVAQPQRGQALSKAIYRIGGTLVGGAAAIVATAAFGQDRTMLLAVFAIWLAGCTFAASLLKDFRAYGAALAGYTLCIVAITDIDAPQAAFMTALDRVAAIVLGVVCVAEVNGAFGRPDAWVALTGTLRQLLADATENAIAALQDEPAPPTGIAGAEQATTILALRTQAGYVSTEFQDGRVRAAGARSAIAALLGMLSASGAIAVGRAQDQPDAPTRAALDRTADALRHPDADDARRRLPSAAQDASPTLARCFLLDRMDELLAQHAFALDGIASLATGSRPARRVRLRTHSDIAGAVLNATRTAIAVAFASVFCIYAGWSGATLMLIEISALSALLGMQPNPTQAALAVALALLLSLPAAAVVKFALLPQGSSFAEFSLAVAPFAFVICILGRHPRLARSGAIMLVLFLLALVPSNPQTYDLAGFLNTAMSLAAAVTATVLGFVLVLPVSPPRRLFRVANAVTRDLRRALRNGCRLDQPALLSLQYDRLATALVWLGRRTPARLAALTHLRDLGELNAALCYARAALDAAARRMPVLAPQAALARAALSRPAPDAASAAACGLLAAAQAAGPPPPQVLRAAAAVYGASLALDRHRRLLLRAGISGRH